MHALTTRLGRAGSALLLALLLGVGLVAVPATPQLEAHASVGLRVLVEGDSYSEGVGDDDLSDGRGWAPVAARQLGWASLTVDGRGGSGYSNPTTYGAGVFCSRLYDHPRDAYDLVIIQGSSNDQAYLYRLAGDANKTLRAARSRYPSARIVVLGPTTPYGRPGDALLRTNRKVLAAAAYVGVESIDPIGQAWFVPGDGATYAKASDPGKGHPNGAGYRLMGTRFAEEYRTL